MSLISLVVVLIIVGLILWLINTYLPLPSPIKQIITVIVVLALILWLASVFLGGFGSIHIGR